MTRALFVYAMLLALLMGGIQASAATTDTTGSINVKAMGAKGDGNHDDTQAFLNAVAKAKAEGKPVYVPMGVYVISKTIRLNKISMMGPEGAAWNADADVMPSIIPTLRNGPAFRLKDGAALGGLDITYKWDKKPTNGPAAVMIAGVGDYIHNMRIRYAWDGIMANGKNNVGRLNIENVFMVAIHNVGVCVTGTWDVARLNNIEIWNAGPVPRGLSKGVGFLLGKNDLIRMNDCFVFAMSCGYRLTDKVEGSKIKGVTWGVMNGCSTDFCVTGIDVEGDHTLSVSGGSFWEHEVSLKVNGKGARVRMSGSELKSNGAPVVQILDSAQTMVTGCTLNRNMKSIKDVPAVDIQGGHAVVTGNQIDAIGDGVVIGKDVQAALVQSNIINSHGYKDIKDTHGPDADVLLSGNLKVTHEPAEAKEPEPKK